jgi:hypothetical protein
MPGRDHAFSAMAALCLIIGYNLVSIMILADSYYDIPANKGKGLIIALVVLLFISNYFIFIYKDRYKKIEERFKNESKNNKIASSIAIIFLVFFTVVLGIYSLSK